MIVPDVNVLVYAFRADSPEHERYADWMNTALTSDTIGLADSILSGFVRVVTHSRIMSKPAPITAALDFATKLMASPGSQWLSQGAPVWRQLDTLAVGDPGIRGNVVPDAYIASLCIANSAVLATRDRGFARFPGLRMFDPAAR